MWASAKFIGQRTAEHILNATGRLGAQNCRKSKTWRVYISKPNPGLSVLRKRKPLRDANCRQRVHISENAPIEGMLAFLDLKIWSTPNHYVYQFRGQSLDHGQQARHAFGSGNCSQTPSGRRMHTFRHITTAEFFDLAVVTLQWTLSMVTAAEFIREVCATAAAYLLLQLDKPKVDDQCVWYFCLYFHDQSWPPASWLK